MNNITHHIYSFVAAATPPSIDLPQVSADSGKITTLLSVMFGIAGALALLMIVLAGFSYITSSGDPQKATKARNGLIYSVAGLAVCILAEVIVNFVIGKI